MLKILRKAGTRSETGVALVEAAIALPFFLLLVFFLIDFSTAFREQISVLDALSQAQRAVAAIASTPDIGERDLLLKAGDIYMRALKAKGISASEVSMGKDVAKKPFVLVGLPFSFPSGKYEARQAYELRSVHIPGCFFCRLTQMKLLTFNVAAVIIREGPGLDFYRSDDNQFMAYFPDYSGDSRAKWITTP